MHDQMFKADAGKPDHSLLEVGFPNALAFVQATLDYGAIKYEAHSWRKVPDAFNRYDKAARRHRNQRDGAVSWNNDFLYPDYESGLPHIAHELFNLMAQIELYLQDHPGIDVRRVLKFNPPPTAHKSAGFEPPTAHKRPFENDKWQVEPAASTMHARVTDAMIDAEKSGGKWNL
jgi:Domain of unknown function (DUF5664)